MPYALFSTSNEEDEGRLPPLRQADTVPVVHDCHG